METTAKIMITLANNHTSLLQVTPTTGVYIYKNKNTPIYIGKAVNLKARLLSHEQNAKYDAKEAQIIKLADTIELIYTSSEFAALLLEARLISKLKPKFNVRWRDDKSNLYIKITAKDEYPKVSLSRKEDDGKSRYFGPFSSTHSAESLLRHIRRIIPFCMQKRISKSACFYHKIGLCNPCPGNIEKMTKEEKNKSKKVYKAHIRSLINVLSDKSDAVTKTLARELKRLTKAEEYEEAIKVRDTLRRLEFLIQHGRIESDFESNIEDKSEASQKALLALLRPFFPRLEKIGRIECYDNSTLGFEHSVSSMVVFENGRSNNQEYRRFRLDPKTAISDFDMMHEVISRRLNNTQWKMPDLIVIDGGKPQLRVVQKVLEKNEVDIPLIGIAKHPDRLLVASESMPTIRPSSQNLGFRLVQSARDEAHRFAKKYHVHLRNKSKMI